MAGIWSEGFESHSNTAQLQRKYASFVGSWSTGTGRIFGNSGSPGNPQAMTTPSLGLQSTWILGWGLRIASQATTLNSGARGIYFERGTAEQVHIEFVNNAGSFEVRLLKGATTLATTTETFAYGVWHHFEISVTMHVTAGAYELRHNEVNVLSATAVNTADSGSPDADVFAIRFGGSISQLLLDDINLKDNTGPANNTFIGDSVVEAVEVTANGFDNDWINDNTAASDVDNFDQVNDLGNAPPDETGPGGTVSTQTPTDRELYTLGNLQQITGTVAFVHVGLQAAIDNIGSRTLKFVMRDTGGSTADGATVTVNAQSYEGFNHVFNRNEALTVDWTISAIDGLQLGFQLVT